MRTDLRSARISKGLTQQQLAELAGTTQSVVSRIESGARTSVDLAPKLAEALGVSVMQLLYPEAA
jgi:transcriptional regulator with XRE-family HTH domain